MVMGYLTAKIKANAETLHKELDWLQSVIEARLNEHEPEAVSVDTVLQAPPPLENNRSTYADIIREHRMNPAERLIMLLALTPHIRPQLLDIFLQPNPVLKRGYTEFGGIQGKTHSGFLPTGETAFYLLAGDDLGVRFACQHLFDRDHFFAQDNLLGLESAAEGEPRISGQLVLSDEVLDLLTAGERRKPDFSRDFPARLLTTAMEPEDLVLSWETLDQLKELEAWIAYEQVLMTDPCLGKRLRPGYKCLFYGPSGTGKTITASVLGKKVGKDVYRIDLSSVVSKYIGEESVR
ncbi:MAG: AAA family ATPase [Candidatus Electrothrix sp. AW5]|nr:AAA family ATPase [Candidatus Electrothrix gigas]